MMAHLDAVALVINILCARRYVIASTLALLNGDFPSPWSRDHGCRSRSRASPLARSAQGARPLSRPIDTCPPAAEINGDVAPLHRACLASRDLGPSRTRRLRSVMPLIGARVLP